jgi:Uma2 family endonuclease
MRGQRVDGAFFDRCGAEAMTTNLLEYVQSVRPAVRIAEPVVIPPPNGHTWTIADLDALVDDGHRYELVEGELQMMTPASPQQGRYASRITVDLGAFVEKHDLGEVYVAEPGFALEPDPQGTVRAPDVAFVAKERIPKPGQTRGFWPLAPDLAVEIISPSETAYSVETKVAEYLRAGVRLIWLVYPETQVVVEFAAGWQVRRLTKGDTLDGGAVVPGFTMALTRLFR